jgi:hypothetical protein
VSCGNVTLHAFPSSSACSGDAECDSTTIGDGLCDALNGCDATGVAAIKWDGNPQYLGGSCTAQPQNPFIDAPPISWGQTARACGPTDVLAGCDPNEVCLPEPSGAATTKAPCVYQNAEVSTCPPGFPDLVLAHQDVMDTRGCSNCSCGAETCELVLITYGSNCMGGTPAGPPNTCITVVSMNNDSIKWDGGGTCQVSGGQPNGSATPVAPVTFCCAQ